MNITTQKKFNNTVNYAAAYLYVITIKVHNLI